MYDSSQGTMPVQGTDSQPTTIYAFGKVQTIPKYQVYQLIDDYIAKGYDPQKVLQEFSNNVVAGPGGYGSSISYQELQGVVNNALKYTGTSTNYGGGAVAEPTQTVDLSGKLAAINQLYDLIYGDLNTQTQARKSELDKAYGEQRTGLQSQYEKSQAVLPSAFAAQGIANSSYLAREAGNAQDTYNQNLAAIQKDQEAKQAQLGQSYQQALAGYQQARANLGSINPTFTGTAADIQGIQSQLDQQVNALSADRSKLMTDSQYRNSLNAIAPTQNMGASQLQEQLAKITNSSIPGYAKDTIAQGLIKQSGQDPNFYTDYYEKIKGGASTPLQ